MARVPFLHVPSLEVLDAPGSALVAPATTPVCGPLSHTFPRFDDSLELSPGGESSSSPDALDRRVAGARARREAQLEARQLHAAQHSAQQAAKVRRVERDESVRAAELAAHIDAKQRQAEQRRQEWLARRASALADAQRRRDRARERTTRLRALFIAAATADGGACVAEGCRRLAELGALAAPALRSTCDTPAADDDDHHTTLAHREARFRLDALESMLMADPFAPCRGCGPTPDRAHCAADPSGPRHQQQLPAAASALLALTVPVVFPGAEADELRCLGDAQTHRAAARHLVVAHHVVLQRAVGPDGEGWAASDDAVKLAQRLVRRLSAVLDTLSSSSCPDTASAAEDDVPPPLRVDPAAAGLTAFDVRGLLLAWDRFSAAAAAGEEADRARVVGGLRQAYVRTALAEQWRQRDIARKMALAATAEAERGPHDPTVRRERLVAPKRAALTQAVRRQMAGMLSKIRTVGGPAAVAEAEAERTAAEAAQRIHSDPQLLC